MKLTIEAEHEADGRWIAEVPELPGVLAYGGSDAEAMAKAEALALRVMAERLENGESKPVAFSIVLRADGEDAWQHDRNGLLLRNGILGCLLGGACGDALGAPVEFLRIDEILRRYGPNGITELDEAHGIVGAITDDTQMTLFTVEGFIRADIRWQLKGICHPPGIIQHAYLRWLETQDRPFGAAGGTEFDGWLIEEPRLWTRRSPGNTCLSALRVTHELGDLPRNDSKGCGGVMRAAPLGFRQVMTSNTSETFDLGADSARLTHGHPSGYLAAGALAVIVGRIAEGSELEQAVADAIAEASERKDAREVVGALESAVRLSSSPTWREGLPELGEGWVAEEALGIAVLCALAASSPQEAIVAAANHSGDSDSTASIAGSMVGALEGRQALPERWLSKLELRDVIETLAEDLALVVEGKADAEALWERYPGH